MAHQLALFYIPGGKMIELRKRQREQRKLRQALVKRHAPGTGSPALHRKSLCGYPVRVSSIMTDLTMVTCKTCKQKLVHGPSLRDAIKEKQYAQVLKTVAW